MTRIVTHPHPHSRPHIDQQFLIGIGILLAIFVILILASSINLPAATVAPSIDRSFDVIEGLRVERAFAVSTNLYAYDDIEALRIQRISWTNAKIHDYDAIEDVRIARHLAAYDSSYDKVEEIRLTR